MPTKPQTSAVIAAVGGSGSSFLVAAFSSGVTSVVPWTPKAGMTAEVVNAVRSYAPSGGGTAMEAALAFCASQLAGTSGANTRVIILVTDGVPDDQSTTLAAAAAAKGAGIKLATVGVGNADSAFLAQLATSTGYAFSALFDYAAVGLASEVAAALCAPAAAAAERATRRLASTAPCHLGQGYADGALRLVDSLGGASTASGTGILEIYKSDWGTVCKSSFEADDMYPSRFTNNIDPYVFKGQINTVCRQLGLDPRGAHVRTWVGTTLPDVTQAWDVRSANCAGQNLCQARSNVDFTCVQGKDEWTTYGTFERLADCTGAGWKEAVGCFNNYVYLEAQPCE